ncbi:MAG: hypothetical protein KAT07_06980 [Calditrichia bacterium]|nr:hypothetical protein [Calditrichia bacterium]
MGSGETLITLGAITMLTTMAISINSSFTENSEYFNKTKFGLESIAIANSVIEEASQLPFDEQCWDSTKVEKVPTDFTLTNDLGTDFGESDNITFDDFDDFHNYSYFDTTMQNVYKIDCVVGYVNPSLPDSLLSNRSLYKKLTVSVKNIINNDSLSLSYVHGFWYFN